MMRFALNDGFVEVEANPALTALEYLRDECRLTGVKHACREGDCGSCVVLLGQPADGRMRYRSATSCLLPLGAVDRHHIVTVEGLNRHDPTPFQRALEGEGASQCGFCTPGFVVSFTGFLLTAEAWDVGFATEAVAGNICRCTGYASIVRAMASTLDRIRDRIDPAEPRVAALVREKLLPEYFLLVPDRLAGLAPPPSRATPTLSEVVISGGTDLYVQRPDEIVKSNVFVVPPSSKPPIRVEDDHVYLTGAATAEDIKTSAVLAETVGGLDRAMLLMGSLPIRHRATIAGNIINASPIGDMTVILLALDAEIGLIAGADQRFLPLRDFFLGYKELDLHPGELVEWVRFSAPGDGALFNFEKVSKRTHLDIASVNTAVYLQIDEGRIASACLAAGGVAPIPMQLERTGAYLSGREPTAATAIAAAGIARSEVTPISDVRGSADYKRLLLGQLILAHFNVLFGIEEDLVTEATA